jgi:hypothetical protein
MKLLIDISNAVYKDIYETNTIKGHLGSVDWSIRNGIPYEDRPTGQWIKESNGKTTDLYICSVCKRSIMLCKGADLTKYPFCHCGADMRKGEEE